MNRLRHPFLPEQSIIPNRTIFKLTHLADQVDRNLKVNQPSVGKENYVV